MRPSRLLFAVLIAAMMLTAAEPPYAGKWKMNPAKSDFGSMTVTYEQLPSGEMQATYVGHSYKFKMDGKDYPDPFGNTAAWKSVDDKTWETVWKLDGKVLATDTLKLSPDGKTLTVQTKGTKPDGEAIDDTITFQRSSGSSGLAGKWKTRNLKSASPNVLEMTPSAADALLFKIVDMDLTCDTKLDGKDYPCKGPTLSSGWTLALVKTGERSLTMTVKRNGQELYHVRYMVSRDGKTLTETSRPASTNETVKAVYDRQ